MQLFENDANDEGEIADKQSHLSDDLKINIKTNKLKTKELVNESQRTLNGLYLIFLYFY